MVVASPQFQASEPVQDSAFTADCDAARIGLTYRWSYGGYELPGTSENKPTADAKLVAGALCLDSANTAKWHASANPDERLRAYGDFMAWSLRAEVLTKP